VAAARVQPARRHGRAPGRVPRLLWLGALLIGACGTTRTFVADPGAYDRVPDEWQTDLAAARLAFDRGDPHTAYSRVGPLCLERPQVVPVRIFLQEIELALLEREGKVGTLVAADPEEARKVLAAFYEKQAGASTRAEGPVLAARLAPDGESALALLDVADAIDPRCIWVHYARAWWRTGLRRFKEARDSLKIALRMDPGHLPSLRLQAILLAGAGDTKDAAAVLEVWLERTSGDPLYSAGERADALLDLAALRVLLGEPRAALDLLEELDPRAVRDPARAEEVRAAAHDARGELTAALEAVRRASDGAPSALLPLVQRAMLLRGAGDPEGERKAWERVVELTEESSAPADSEDLSSIDFVSNLYRLQALARLERLARGEP